MATIKDVAKLVGMAPSTVSRAMHDSPLISEATKKKVRAAMEELNYSPSFTAQNLANKSNNLVGIILPANQADVSDNPFFIQIIQGISEICNAHGYMLTVASGVNDQELLKNTKMLIEQGQVTCFIFAYSVANDPILNYIKSQKNLRYVVIGTPYELGENSVYFVDNDNIKAGSDATEYLFEKGYTNPTFVYSNLMEIVQNDRYLGYQRAMRVKGLEDTALKLNSTDPQKNQGLVQKFLKENPNVDAFIASDDLLALDVQRQVASEKYGILGFNNSIFAQISNPPLTSVDIFPRFLGLEAAALVINWEDKLLKLKQNSVIVPHKIIERESSQSK